MIAKTVMLMLLLMLLLLLMMMMDGFAAAEDIPECTDENVLRKLSHFSAGERIFSINHGKGRVHDYIEVKCAAVGEGGTVVDPVSVANWNGGVYNGRSISSCSWIEENGGTSSPLEEKVFQTPHVALKMHNAPCQLLLNASILLMGWCHGEERLSK